MSPRLCLLGRQRLSTRVQGGCVDTSDLPGVRQRRQQRVVGARCCTRSGCKRERQPGGRCETICYGRKRLPGQALGVQCRDWRVGEYPDSPRTYRLGARRSMESYGAVQELHCKCESGQDGAHLDVFGSAYVLQQHFCVSLANNG